MLFSQVRRPSTARRQSVPSSFYQIACKNKAFPRAKLGAAQHRDAVLTQAAYRRLAGWNDAQGRRFGVIRGYKPQAAALHVLPTVKYLDTDDLLYCCEFIWYAQLWLANNQDNS